VQSTNAVVQTNDTLRRRSAIFVVFGLTFWFVLRGSRDYAPFTEGWWHVYVRWLNEGRVPYRDFELLVPPGYPYLLRAITTLIGEQFLALRFFGAIQIGLIAVCVFFLITRLVSLAMAVVISVSTTAYITSGTAFFGYDYVYTATLFMLCSFCLCIRLETRHPSVTLESLWKWIALGSLVACATLVKQTQGVCTVIGVATLLAVFGWGQWPSAVTKMLLVVFGVGAVWVPLVTWFAINELPPSGLVRAIYVVNGAKGSGTEIFFSWIHDIFSFYGESGVRAAVASTVGITQQLAPWIGLAMLFRRFPPNCHKITRTTPVVVGVVLLFAVVSMFREWNNLGVLGDLFSWVYDEFRRNVFVGSWFAVVFFSLWYRNSSLQPLSHKLVWSIAVVVFAVVWACGMSAGLTEIGVFASFGVALGMFVFFSREHWTSVVASGVICAVVVSGSWWGRQNTPYQWWEYEVPSAPAARFELQEGLARGLYTSPEVAEARHEIYGYLEALPKCQGELVAYPHMPVFLLDQERTPGGRLAQYWFDFSSQEAISEEVERLNKSEVSAIIMMDLPDSVTVGHEQLFNDGRSITHRVLQRALQGRTDSLTEVVQLPLGSSATLRFWISDCLKELR